MEDNYIVGKDGLSVFKFTPDKSLDKWTQIDSLIRDYSKVHGEEVKEVLFAAHGMRQEAQKKNTLDMKQCLMLPAGLNIILKREFPDLFTDRMQMQQFMKKFPGFSTIN